MTRSTSATAALMLASMLGCSHPEAAWEFRSSATDTDTDGSGSGDCPSGRCLPPVDDLGNELYDYVCCCPEAGSDPPPNDVPADVPPVVDEPCCSVNQNDPSSFDVIIVPAPCPGEVGEWFGDEANWRACVVANESTAFGVCVQTVQCWFCPGPMPSSTTTLGACAAATSACPGMIGD